MIVENVERRQYLAMESNNPELISTEKLAYWFFRLNGCLSIQNFLVHHERKGCTGTDVDILAMRFPYRKELARSNRPMKDYPIFSHKKIDLIIAEVKTGNCALNGPWTDPEKGNMDRVLQAVGAFEPEEIRAVAEALYGQQVYENERIRCRLFAIGKAKNDRLGDGVCQLDWTEILAFIHSRFVQYEWVKAPHNQWDKTGKMLYELAISYRDDKEVFVARIMSKL